MTDYTVPDYTDHATHRAAGIQYNPACPTCNPQKPTPRSYQKQVRGKRRRSSRWSAGVLPRRGSDVG